MMTITLHWWHIIPVLQAAIAVYCWFCWYLANPFPDRDDAKVLGVALGFTVPPTFAAGLLASWGAA